jgi:hypothetical protein
LDSHGNGSRFGSVVIWAALLPSLAPLSRENGVFETTSLRFWGAAFVAGLFTFRKYPEARDRWAAGWTMLVSLLAFLREMDAHVLLNPDHLGRFAVRYRIEWWLNGSVSIWLKLGWLALGGALFLVLLYPLVAMRLPFVRMTMRGDAIIGLFVAAVIFSGMGVVTDDLLRGSKWIPFNIRQVIEEGSEMLGSAAFFGSTMLRWRNPLRT